MVDKAIDVVTQERARYFVERIARTEKARAYMDGAMYPYAHDPDCASFKWKLLSRHPCDDICDLYPYRFVRGWTKAFFKMTVGIMQGKLPWLLKRRGAVIFLVFQSIWGGAMKREIMIHSQDQILRVFLYFSIRKPSISVIIIAI